jgi:hypothetical protein
MYSFSDLIWMVIDIPDGEDTTGLSESGLFLDTSNSLFEDRRNLGRSGFGISEATNLDLGSVEGCWCNSS